MLIQTQQQFDVIIYGASVAGIAAAIRYAQNGVRVALIDPPMTNDYKDRLDYVTSSADKLLRSLLQHESSPAIPGKVEFWTRWGWIRSDAANQGYFVHQHELRERLLNYAHETSGITRFHGAAAEQIIRHGSTVTGIQIQQGGRDYPLQLLARLIVVAGDVNARFASMLNLKQAQTGRVYFRAFYELSGLPRAQFWLLEPDVAAIIAHGSRLTEVIYAPTSLAAFQQDTEGHFAHALAGLPDAPYVPDSTRISQVMRMETTLGIGQADHHAGLAFIGAAKLALPLFRANQMSMEIQSAHWLVENTLQALMVTGELENALHAYRQQHRQATRAYQQHNDELANGRRFNNAEKLALAAAAHNPAAAARFFAYLNQSITRSQLLKPDSIFYALLSKREPIPDPPVSVPQSS